METYRPCDSPGGGGGAGGIDLPIRASHDKGCDVCLYMFMHIFFNIALFTCLISV